MMELKKRKKIVFTITNNISYDQRMLKICTSLAAKYDVLLVGVAKFLPLEPLQPQVFAQKRLPLFFKQGLLSFAESNFRMFWYLLFKKFDAICAIDLDTILPVYFLSVLKRKKRVYDAHELFCETHDVALKPRTRKIWKAIEKIGQPRFKKGYTVNNSLAEEYEQMYGVKYIPILNAPVLQNTAIENTSKPNKTILYQGVVSNGRGFEHIIPAMQHINSTLLVYGKGNYLDAAKRLTKQYLLANKIEFKGYVLPHYLKAITANAYIGLNIIERKGKSYYLSLSNRTFDYIHAEMPQVAMRYPEYEKINKEYEVAVLINELNETNITNAINALINDAVLYDRLKKNCAQAKLHYNWQQEEKKLIAFYENLFKKD